MKKNSTSIEGKKGVLWWQIDDILREKRPSYVILENVDRLIRSPAKQCGRDFSIILRCFYQKGYAVEWRVINAVDYGQAQRRRRTFIIAYHNRTKLFQDFAEAVCLKGLKAMHKQVAENGITPNAFPIPVCRRRCGIFVRPPKHCAENAHYYELLYYLQQLKNEPLQKTQQFLLK